MSTHLLHANLLGGGGDGVNGAHEHICHHEDPEEAVDDAGEIESDPYPDRPTALEEEREQHSLHGARILASTDCLPGLHITHVGEVAGPVTLQTLHS